MRRGAPAARGFTLIELLIAVSIFAILAVVAYGALRTVLSTRAHTDVQMRHLAQLQMAYAMMQRDIEQAVPRTVRDEYGDPEPAMIATGGDVGGAALAMTRLGWRNPTGRPRSFMQRVAYVIKDHSLVRRFWTELDRAQQSDPVDSDLLDDIKGVDMRFLDPNAQWQNQWPPLTQGNAPQAQTALPRAVEVTVNTRYWGSVKWLFRVPG